MLVYRVEDDTQTGPFQASVEDWLSPIAAEHGLFNPDGGRFYDAESNPLTPGPVQEGFDYPTYRPYFGFSCEDQFKQWFPEPIARALCDAGFVLATYEVPDPDEVLVGQHQVIFDLGRARKVAERSPVEPHRTLQ